MAVSMRKYVDELGLAANNRLFIDNRWVEPECGDYFPQISCVTQEVLSHTAQATVSDVDRAVKAARKAFDTGPWPRMGASERRRYMIRLADLFEKHSDELGRAQTVDNGIPYVFTRTPYLSGMFAADLYHHFAGWIDKINGEVYPRFTDAAPLQFIGVREPAGVVATILPWNVPVLQFPNKTAAALACGCTVVVKPSELGSMVTNKYAEIIAEADLPPGVLNFVTGPGSTGEALVTHPGIDKITFTGSRAVGGRILALSGKDIKRVTLELGGKSAAILFPDAPDFEQSCRMIMEMITHCLSGQICSTTSRVLVHRSVMDRFLEICKRLGAQNYFGHGDPFDPATMTSPLVDRKQLDKVMGYIHKGREEGARLLFGGDRPGGELMGGNWVNPTMFVDVDNSMAIAREEIFGPVLCVMPFDTEEEAVRIANDNDYGLSAGVYTSNLNRALRVGKALRTGTVGINGYSYMPNSPFGGFKASGLGREGGWPAIESFTEIKTLIVNEGISG